MPLTTTRALRVRYSDCDAYGHLNSANYLRYMQETAFDASAAAGYDQTRYDEIQRTWLIRESQVEYLTPLRYNDLVEVKTWIGDFKRASSRRLYEFRHAGSDSLAARAFTDWVFLDTRINRPTAIPPEVITAFCPEGAPSPFPHREPYPTPPPAPAGAFRMRRRVEWHDIDTMLHVNNAIYMVYAGECGFQAVAHFGWPWQRMQAEGFAIYLRRAWLQYLQPAMPGDEVEVLTWIYDVRRVTAIRHYQIRRVSDGALLAQVNTTGVWVNIATGQPVRIPEPMRVDFAANIA
jgi:acyl-CoA thioester hydrolase